MAEKKPDILYRTVIEDDFPIIKDMYVQLNKYFDKFGYNFPHPDNVGDLWLESFRRTLGRFSQVHIAEMNDAGSTKVVGYILSRLKRVPAYIGGVMVAELSDMWVLPEVRRLGIGDKLIRMAIEWTREQNVHSVEIQVLRDHMVSWNLFEGMGFMFEFRVGRLLWENYQVDDASENPPKSS